MGTLRTLPIFGDFGAQRRTIDSHRLDSSWSWRNAAVNGKNTHPFIISMFHTKQQQSLTGFARLSKSLRPRFRSRNTKTTETENRVDSFGWSNCCLRSRASDAIALRQAHSLLPHATGFSPRTEKDNVGILMSCPPNVVHRLRAASGTHLPISLKTAAGRNLISRPVRGQHNVALKNRLKLSYFRWRLANSRAPLRLNDFSATSC